MKVLLKLVKQDDFIGLEVQEDDLVDVAIEKVAERYNVSPKQIRLIHKQYILQSKTTFREANVFNDAVINVTITHQHTVSSASSVKEKELPKKSSEAFRRTPEQQPQETNQQPLPKSYLAQIGVKPSETPSVENPSKPKSAGKERCVINPHFIEGMCSNPLLPAYLEDLIESPERISACLNNPNVKKLLHAFAGGDPLLEANIMNPRAMQGLVKRSMEQSLNQQQIKATETVEYQALRAKWHRELCVLRKTGLPIKEIQALDLLERYNGDVQEVFRALLRK